MAHRWKHNPVLWLAIGLMAGVAISPFCPHAPLHATATDRYDTFAIATGYVDEGLEAIYFLDFLTGDLRAAMLSKQIPTRFNAFFERNIIQDLGVDPSKNPRYLMVTGMADIRRGGSKLKPSAAVVYVAEITTGQVAAYALPWDTSSHAAGQVFKSEIIPMAKFQFRTAPIRQ